jgi:CRISPR-associated protein Csm5
VDAAVCKVECLSPVHIGSGDEFIRGIDFYRAGEATEVLDPQLALRTFGALEGFADSIRRGALGEFLKARAASADACRLYRVPGALEAVRLRAAIRCGDGRPIIAGSSIKGALRTLLLVAWSGEGGPHSLKRTAPARDALWSVGYGGRSSARRLEEALFHFSRDHLGVRDPKTDASRTLMVSDAAFAPGSLELVSGLALGTTRNTLTTMEALPRRATAVLMLRAGDELLDPRLPWFRTIPDIKTLAGWSHQHARYLLAGDLDFFKAHAQEAAVERLEALTSQVNRAAPDAIILRLGWGSGWRTMTGDILTPDERSRVMRRIGKTRKVIIEGHAFGGRPCDVPGWIRIEPVAPVEAAAISAANRSVPIEIEAALEPEPAHTPTPAQARPPLAQRDSFAAALANLKPRDWGKVGGLIQQAAGHPDPRERERRLALVAQQLVRTFSHDRRRMRDIAQIAELAPYLKEG